MNANRRTLVTGGNGFIGRHLLRRLVSLGSQTVSLGRNGGEDRPLPGVHYISGALSPSSLRTVPFEPEMVFHLAGGSSVSASNEDPSGDFLKTVFSTELLLDHLRRHWPATRLLYVSSAAVYGEAEHMRASRNLGCLPISPYGMHKRMAEMLLFDHGRVYGTKSVIVRPFSVYGPGLRKQLLWDAMQKSERGQFEFFGTGQELRDWVYVEDLVECLLRASQNASTKVPVYNAGTGCPVSVREVLTILSELARWSGRPIFLDAPRPGDPARLVAEDSAEDELGPLFRTPLREGMRAYVNWYQSRGGRA